MAGFAHVMLAQLKNIFKKLTSWIANPEIFLLNINNSFFFLIRAAKDFFSICKVINYWLTKPKTAMIAT